MNNVHKSPFDMNGNDLPVQLIPAASHVTLKRPQSHQWLYLQTASFYRVEHKQLLQQVFTVCGHVERNTILPSQDPLPQLLHAADRQRDETKSIVTRQQSRERSRLNSQPASCSYIKLYMEWVETKRQKRGKPGESRPWRDQAWRKPHVTPLPVRHHEQPLFYGTSSYDQFFIIKVSYKRSQLIKSRVWICQRCCIIKAVWMNMYDVLFTIRSAPNLVIC